MANTYTQIYVMMVFGTKGRNNLITAEHEEEIYKYISGIIKNKTQKLLQINGMPDHIHMVYWEISLAERFWSIFLFSFPN